MPVYLLDQSLRFPDPELAEGDGLVAVGGDLGIPRLLEAYRQGFFPWFNPGDPILWWHPDPRYVLFPERLKVSKSLRALLKRHPWRVSLDNAFDSVIRHCAGPSLARPEAGTWITEEMIRAYSALHQAGYAHSVEVWDRETLVAGLYGVHIGGVFFGESMFTRVPNASKYGFVLFVRWLQARGCAIIDCQQGTEHLISLGAEPLDRRVFQELLHKAVSAPAPQGQWMETDISALLP
jgi:leucyl/phenylalanyl-tRNA---protein transferase